MLYKFTNLILTYSSQCGIMPTLLFNCTFPSSFFLLFCVHLYYTINFLLCEYILLTNFYKKETTRPLQNINQRGFPHFSLRIVMFPYGKFDMQAGYAITPHRAAAHIECNAYIEGAAHIENPVWDLYRKPLPIPAGALGCYSVKILSTTSWRNSGLRALK